MYGLHGVWRRIPDASFTRVPDTRIAGADDPRVLEYAVEQGYIILSHDVNAMRGYFYDRIMAGLPTPGLFLVHKQMPMIEVIDALKLIILAGEEHEWHGWATYIL